MKYLLLFVSVLLTACASTMPPKSASECAEQYRRLVEQEIQLKLRKEAVQQQLQMSTPTELKHAMLPRTGLVDNFNKQVDILESQMNVFNAQCVKKQ